MPIDVLPIIERLTRLRDALSERAAQLHQANRFKISSEEIELIEHWGKVKDRLQEIVNLNSSIDHVEQGIAEGDKEALHPVVLERFERDKVALKNKLKTVNRLETKGNQLLRDNTVPGAKEPPPAKAAPKKKPAAKPAPKPKAAPKASDSVTVDDYQARMDQLKAQSERAVIAQLPALEQQAYTMLVEWVGALDTEGGRLVANQATRTALNNFTDLYLTTFTELSDYQGMISKYLKNFKSISQLQEEFQKSRGIDPVKAQVGSAQEVVIAEIIDRYTENGLNKGFVQPLRELLFNNVAGGLNKKEALAQAKDFIQSGKDSTGKLALYLEQTAQQGVDSYEGATNSRIMQAYKINTLMMSGSLIKTSSPQCRYCINELGGIIDRSDWPDVTAIAEKHGLIDGTTFDNVSFNKLHWGCRHSFTPVVLTSEERSQLLQNPTNL